jgi:hypothetical protein
VADDPDHHRRAVDWPSSPPTPRNHALRSPLSDAIQQWPETGTCMAHAWNMHGPCVARHKA